MDKIFDQEQLAEIILNGGVILYPTDTIRGIGCDAANEAAVERIFTIKQRPKEKSVIVLFPSAKMLSEYGVNLSPQQQKFLAQAVKPTTMVVYGLQGLAPNVYHTDGSVGVRIVKLSESHQGAQRCHELLTKLQRPLVSTSANISGQPAGKLFDEIAQEIKDAVDGFPAAESSLLAGEPSQIVRIDTGGEVTILRA